MHSKQSGPAGLIRERVTPPKVAAPHLCTTRYVSRTRAGSAAMTVCGVGGLIGLADRAFCVSVTYPVPSSVLDGLE